MADQSYLAKIAALPDAPLQDGVEHAADISPKIVDIWAWWRKALANPKEIGKSLPIHESEPNVGYFRTKSRTGGFDPVAIFYPEGSSTLVAYRANQEVRPDEIWTWCCRAPVTFEAYTDAVDGKGWPDDDATVAAQVKPPEPMIGDNSGKVDEAEVLKDQIDAAKKGAGEYAVITSDEQNAKALSLRNRLNELSGQADKKREEEKAPHLKAGKEIDAHWQPLVKGAKEAANNVRGAMETWETKKLQEQRKREREVEQARLAAEEAARKREPDAEVMEAPAPSPAPVEAAPAPIKATYGKAASVSVKIVVDEVTDWQALAIYMCGHPTMQDTLRQLAQRALDAGRTNIPGITTTEKAAVR